MDDLEKEETISIFETATEREAKLYISKNLKSIKIKSNLHVSPNTRLAWFRKFKCFDNITLIGDATQEKLEFKLVREGLVLSAEAVPLKTIEKLNDKDIKKYNSSLMGRALKNYGILSIEEMKGLGDEETEDNNSGFEDTPDSSGDGWDFE